jgi:hypothetical protein
LPSGRTLTDGELAQVLSKPLSIVSGAGQVVAVSEHPEGLHVRADDCVLRMNPEQTAPVSLRAAKFGKPLPAAQIDLVIGTPFLSDVNEPPTGVPLTALTFAASVACDNQGVASASIQAHDPQNPRGYIDGQVYRIDYALQGQAPFNRSDFLSVLVWDAFVPNEPPTWFGSMKNIFEQYGNLYPIMLNASIDIDLRSYSSISTNRLKIIDRLSRAPTDPKYMPISRELSDAKKAAMIRWLTNVGADNRPLLGAPPPPVPMGAGGMLLDKTSASLRLLRAVELNSRTKQTESKQQ